MSFVSNPQERGRFLRFAVVGTIGAVIDFGAFNLLVSFAHLDPVLASIASFTAAVVSNFIWNRYWTYPDSRSKPVARQLVEFAVISVLGLAIRTPLFAVLEKPLPRLFTALPLPAGLPVDAQFLGHNTALAITVVVVMFWNFFVNRYWTYGDVK
ncbi:MAG: GtrA family protein [Anaerolineales bacterium]|nr:GtrA family protein [Anaerolineales bacterium]